MKRVFIALIMVFAMAVVAVVNGLGAQTKPQASGRWEGTIDVPGQPIGMFVDLAGDSSGKWVGVVAVPLQGLKDFPLSNIRVNGLEVSFAMLGVPGDPVFSGKISADGKVLAGELAQAGITIPFKLERKGEAVIAKSTAPAVAVSPEAAELSGSWQGALDVGGQALRLILKISRQADGALKASLDSPDQGSNDMPINSLTVSGDKLRFEMKFISATYEGKLNKERTEVQGYWEQGGASLPLVLKREVKKP